MTTITMRPTSEDPPLGIPWADANGDPIDFSNHTFTLKLRRKPAGTVALTKTTGIAGYATWQGDDLAIYNVLATWTAAELSALTAGLYEVDLVAVDPDGRERPYEGPPILYQIKIR